MIVVAAPAGLALLAGCVTSRLHEDKQYVEKVESILITSDHKQIVVLGGSHHYIFQAPPELLALVESDLRPALTAEFHRFVVEADNSISGSLDLYLTGHGGSPTALQIARATTLGMTRGRNGSMQLPINLTGTRFAATGAVTERIGAMKLNKSYSVQIVERPSVAALGVRAALTPVTVAADGVLMLAAIPLLPIFALIAIGGCNACR